MNIDVSTVISVFLAFMNIVFVFVLGSMQKEIHSMREELGDLREKVGFLTGRTKDESITARTTGR